jgi:DNA-binding NarL/FixJ family response regulator
MSAASKSIATRRGLLIDDQILFREGLLRLFSTRRAWRWAGGSYAEAVELTRQFESHVVILGFSGEEMTRLKTLKIFRRQFPRLPMLLLDEVLRSRNIQGVLAVGGCGYWTKQAAFSQLLQALESLLQGESVFCPEVLQFLHSTPKGWIYHPPHRLPPLHLLTPRQSELLLLLARGLTLRRCAEQMGISVNTVDNHRSRLMRKLKVHKAADLARLAVQEGLLGEE